MIEVHPDEAELVQRAFGEEGRDGDEMPGHLAECVKCRGVIEMLRTQANAMRAVAVRTVNPLPDCLDEESIAALAEGNIAPPDSAAAVAHLVACARCREELASVARLVDAPEVKFEIERLAGHPRAGRRRHLGRIFMLVGALAAGLLIMLLPESSRFAKRLYREESVTGSAAPRLVAPVGEMTGSDAFRWTSVPRADQYQITIFAPDGSVITEAKTRDTAIVLPQLMARVPNDTILWRVAAHVGWEDRWTSSELEMLAVRRARR